MDNIYKIPPWFNQIVSAEKKEANIKSLRWVQLATIGLDSFPRVRTVVFRGWSDLYEMKIITDIRSQKFNELKSNKNVEICWIFSKSKCQFRFRGISKLIIGAEKLELWENLNKQSKSMWGWPTPGERLGSNTKEDLAIDDKFKIHNFVLIKIDIFHVDQLILKKPKHIRKRWIRKDEWIEELINP